MRISTGRKAKPYKGMGMEGMIATWYAKNTGKNIAEFRDLAKRIADDLQPGNRVLEVAPGPGYLAIELARLGSYRVTGLDVSRSFVRIASENAVRADVEVDFREGDAAVMPLPPMPSTSSYAARRSRTSAIPSAPCSRCIVSCAQAGGR